MAQKEWYLHVQGDTFGPLTTDVVATMLKQNRLQFSDYVWTVGLAKWIRLGEVQEFQALLPPYPAIPIPVVREKKEPKVEKPVAVKATPKVPAKAPIRKHVRVQFEAKVTVDGYGTFKATNVSEGGVFLKAAKGIPLGTDLKFTLECSALEKPLSMTGILIREGQSDGESGLAIEFTKMNPAHRRLLQQIVQSEKPSEAA